MDTGHSQHRPGRAVGPSILGDTKFMAGKSVPGVASKTVPRGFMDNEVS